ncbi:MAG TPA: TlpA disulfide reductase family protein [Gammaproteobacteria bacterium]
MRKLAKPTLVTLALSGAAVLGYLAYRVTLHAPSGDDPAADTAPAGLRDTLPSFTLENLDGEQQSIRSWPGKPLVVNFWATWCAPCLREIPMLKTFQEANPWLTVVGIAVDREEPVRAFAEDMDFNYPILMGEADAVNAAASFGVEFVALPFTIFTDAEGRTLGVHTGELHPEHLDNLLAVLGDLRSGRASLEDARARIAGTR